MDPRNWRQLPDGTWMNKTTGVVEAPMEDAPRMSATAGPTAAAQYKTQPAPPGTTLSPPLVAAGANPYLTDLNGYGSLPGTWGLNMRPGRNYPALGEGEGLTGSRKLIAIGAIVGIAALTVWLQNRSKKSKAK